MHLAPGFSLMSLTVSTNQTWFAMVCHYILPKTYIWCIDQPCRAFRIRLPLYSGGTVLHVWSSFQLRAQKQSLKTRPNSDNIFTFFRIAGYPLCGLSHSVTIAITSGVYVERCRRSIKFFIINRYNNCDYNIGNSYVL